MPYSQIEKIASLGALANATLDMEKLLRLVIDAIGRLVNSEAASVLMLEGDELVFISASGRRGKNLSRMRLPREKSVAWWVVENGRTYITNDTSSDDFFSGYIDRQIDFRTRSILAVPVRLEGKIFGVMEAINKKRGRFSEQDRRILEAFSDLVAVAIKNAQIFDKLKSANEMRISEMEAEYQLIGVSKAIERIRGVISRVAKSPSTVLITGESGVGKEVVARQLHIQSDRADAPFIKVSCPSFPETLLESELFGHERGAFTGATGRRIGRFEAAKDGTIFLDEIGELPMTVQAKLLRVLQENIFERLGSNEPIHTDARIIAATNRNLFEEIERKNFRQDLYFRLNVVPIYIPPLRERKEDILPLAEHFLRKLRRKFPHPIEKISDEAMEIMQNYDWPGNVRELENTIERIAVLCAPRIITPEHLPDEILKKQTQSAITEGSLPEMERQTIENALRKAKGKQTVAAKILGISRDKLRYRIEKYGINPKDFK